MGTRRQRSRAGSFELMADLTARLASTSRLDHIAGPIVDQIAALGFGMVWVARLDENGRRLLTIKEVIDGTDTTSRTPEVMLDMRRPIGHGFRQRRMVNIQDPDALYILDEDSEPIPPGVLALPRGMYRHLGGSPFACGPLLGSARQPVGALGLCAYRGRRPIPDALFERGLLRALMDQLGIAAERTGHIIRLGRLSRELAALKEALARDAPTARAVDIVQDVLLAMAHDLRQRSITVDLEAGAVPAVRADPALLRQVVLDLLLDARDALDQVPERRSLRVRVREEEAGVRIRVAGDDVCEQVGSRLAAARAAVERMGGQLSPCGGAVEILLRRAG